MGLGLAVDIFDLNCDIIRTLRDAKGWTRERLSDESGVPARTIQNIETGHTDNPGIETMKALLGSLAPKMVEDPQVTELITLIRRLDDDQLASVLGIVRSLVGSTLARNNRKSSTGA